MATVAREVSDSMPLARPIDGQHWYDRQGRPVYEVRGANGCMRPATLRDARKLGLVPGFSAISAMEHKPMLEKWKIDQALMSALTLPKIEGESLDAFAERARTDAGRQAQVARDRGIEIHAAIEGFFEDRNAPIWTDMQPFVHPVIDWLAERFGTDGWEAERTFAHPLGFGGKADLRNFEIGTIDFKCKDFGPEKKAKDLAWPENVMQLSSYAQGFGIEAPACVNIFVSTRVPGLIVAHEWKPEEIEKGWRAFRCLLRLWQLRRDYDSSFWEVGEGPVSESMRAEVAR